MDWFCSCLSKKDSSVIMAYKPINSAHQHQGESGHNSEINIGRATPSGKQKIIPKPKEITTEGSGFISIKQLIQSCGEKRVFRKIEKSKYEQILADCSKTNKKYEDKEFTREVCNKNTHFDVRNAGIAEWKRLPEIIPDATFMKYPINSSEIMQGQINDCYWMASVASLAAQEYRIKNIFASLEISPYGVYMCKLTFNGIPKEVVVDDYFPVDGNGRLIYAQPYKGTDCWVLILEKCWAKVYGSYSKIEWGYNIEALSALTGCPVKSIQISDFKSAIHKCNGLFNYIKKVKDDDDVITTSIQTKPNIGQFLKIFTGHSYSILGVYEIANYGTKYRLVQIRNPFGSHGRKDNNVAPNIPFGIEDEFWNTISEDERRRVQYPKIVNSGDGIFYMEFPVYMQTYDYVDICHINDNAHYIYEVVPFEAYIAQYIKLQIEDISDRFYLIVAQPEQRRFMTGKWSYVSINVMVGRVSYAPNNKTTYEYVTSRSYNHDTRTNYFPADLGIKKSGTYYIRIDTAQDISLTLAYYSPDNFEAGILNDIDDVDFMNRLLLDRVRKIDAELKVPLPNANGWKVMQNIPGSNICYAVFHINSTSQYKKYRITADVSQSKSQIKFLGDDRGETTIDYVVERGKEAIYIYLHTKLKEGLADPDLLPNFKDSRVFPQFTFTPIQS